MLLPLQKLLTQHSLLAKGRGDFVKEFSIEELLSNLGLDGDNVLEEVSLETSLFANLSDKKNSENWKFAFDTTIQQGTMYLVPGFEMLGYTWFLHRDR